VSPPPRSTLLSTGRGDTNATLSGQTIPPLVLFFVCFVLFCCPGGVFLPFSSFFSLCFACGSSLCFSCCWLLDFAVAVCPFGWFFFLLFFIFVFFSCFCFFFFFCFFSLSFFCCFCFFFFFFFFCFVLLFFFYLSLPPMSFPAPVTMSAPWEGVHPIRPRQPRSEERHCSLC